MMSRSLPPPRSNAAHFILPPPTETVSSPLPVKSTFAPSSADIVHREAVIAFAHLNKEAGGAIEPGDEEEVVAVVELDVVGELDAGEPERRRPPLSVVPSSVVMTAVSLPAPETQMRLSARSPQMCRTPPSTNAMTFPAGTVRSSRASGERTTR